MSETLALVKHTPGPWQVDGDRNQSEMIIRQASSHGRIAYMEFTTGYADADEANARLIAAAPELLEALERLSAFAEQMFASFAPVEQEELRPDLELAEAAIRKAKDSALQEILPEKKEA